MKDSLRTDLRCRPRSHLMCSFVLITSLVIIASCGRTPHDPQAGLTQCAPSCAELCARTIGQCSSQQQQATCEYNCLRRPQQPTFLCLKQLACDTQLDCRAVSSCQVDPQVPDLWVKSFSVTSPGPGSLLWRAVVCNNGGGSTRPTTLAFYRDRTSAPQAGDLGDRFLPLQPLSPGQCASFEQREQNVTAGTYRSWLFADSSNAVVELEERNNTSGPRTVTVQTQVTQLPDLQITRFEANRAGDRSISYSYEVCNRGKEKAGTTYLDIYYHRESAPSSNLAGDRTRYISSLAGGSCKQGTLTAYTSLGGTLKSWARVDRRDRVKEGNESNNVVGPVLVSGGSDLPDLQISYATAKVSGNVATYTVKACNYGKRSSAATSVAFWPHLNTSPTPGSSPEQTRPIPALAFGACFSVSFKATLSSGTYRSGFYVDLTGAVIESNETNNAYWPLTVHVGGAYDVDLSITYFSAAPSAGKVTYHLTVCNLGKTASSYTQLDFYHKLYSRPTSSSTPQATRQLQPIKAGSCRNEKLDFSLNQGSYSAWVYVNRKQLVKESNTNNNIAGPRSFTVSQSKIDLSISQFNITTSPVGATYNVKVCNKGSAASSSTLVEIFHRTTPPTNTTKALLSVPVIGISPGQCRNVSGHLSLGGGSYTAWAWVNRYNKPAETNTSNNLVGPRYFQISGTVNQPDLHIASGHAAASSTGNVTFTFQVCNKGQSGSPSTVLALFYNPPQPPSTGDSPNYSTTVPYLPPGYCETRKANTFLLPGSYKTYAYIDFKQGVKESNENNNVYGFTHVVGTLGPDLAIDGFTFKINGSGGVDYTVRVCNVGKQPSPATKIHLFYNRNSAPTSSDVSTADKSAAVGTLNANACTQLVVSGTPSPGFNSSWVAVDLEGLVPEVSETNNNKHQVVIVPSTTANLTVQSFAAQPTTGGTVDYAVKVCNSGQGPTPASTVRLYYNRASAPTVGAAGDKDLAVSPLLPKACVSLAHQATLTAGSYTSWAFVDPTGALPESSETDNQGGPLSVTVGATVDPCEAACKLLVSPCNMLPASQEATCVLNCKSLPQSKIDCAGQAAAAGQCSAVVSCLFT